jgi:hypothetical protein
VAENSSQNNQLGLDGILKFQISRKTRGMAKCFLVILEELLDSKDINEDQFKKYRKHTLDECGSAERELDSLIDRLDISLKT